MVLGSVHYMSPEQAAGDKLDGRSDLYSLGVVGFQILSGRLPFDADAAATVMAQQVTKPAPSLGAVASGLPRQLVAVIDRSLSKSPGDRYPTGESFADALETALQSAALPAVAGSLAEVVSTDQARAIWLRAAQLQAEATTRLQARYREPAGGDAPVGSLPSGGYRLQDVEQAASEAGIAAEFVAMAIAERPAGTEVGPADLSAREDRTLTRMLGTRDRSISSSRVIRAAPKEVLEAIGRVLTAPPYGLKLRDTVGGHPLDGGVLVFDVSLLRNVIVAFDGVLSMFRYRMTQLEIEQLHVALKPVGSPTSGCEVTVSADLRRGLRKAWLVDKWVTGVVGLVGAAAGAGIGLTIALGPLAAAVAATGALVAGGASLAGCRWGYRYALKKGRVELEGMLTALGGDLRAASVFGTPPPAAAHRLPPGSGDPNEAARRALTRARSGFGGDSIEEIHLARLQRILRPDHQQSLFPDQLLQHHGTVAEMVGGGPDVEPDRLFDDRLAVGLEAGGEQSLDRGPDAVDDGLQVAGLILGGSLQLIERGGDGPALRVAEHHHEAGAELRGGKLHAPHQ